MSTQKVTARPHERVPMMIVTRREYNNDGKLTGTYTFNLLFDDAIMVGKLAEQEKQRQTELGMFKGGTLS